MGKFYVQQPPVTYLDMDGVVAAWSESAFRLFDKEMPAPPAPMPYDVEQTIGVTQQQMWTRANAQGVEWWANLPEYPWSRALYDGLVALGPPVVFLTSPCTFGISAHGKVRWLRRFLGDRFRDYVITAQKHLLAHPRAVLVDDSDDKLVKFERYGGSAVVFPRQWNSGGYVKPEDIVGHTVARVRDAFLTAGVRL